MTLFDSLSQHSAHLPDALQAWAGDFCARLAEASAPEHLAALGDDRFRASALKVCACSQFIGDNWLRHPGLLPELV
ncbi:hypothetical protein, partial [Methylomonas koyamae]